MMVIPALTPRAEPLSGRILGALGARVRRYLRGCRGMHEPAFVYLVASGPV